MNTPSLPSEAPPTYAQATGSSQTPNSSSNSSTRPQPNVTSNPIPASARRSMEDENRPLPKGWIRQFDPVHSHQFFVDINKEPPRSIWHHPYDDDDYLASLPSSERQKLDINKKTQERPSSQGSLNGAEESSVQASSQQKNKFGRRLKDKLTGMTHEQRVAERERRAKEEQEQYAQYLAMRDAMRRAYQTGEPQLVGKDRDGRDIYVEPPGSYGIQPGYRNHVYVSPYGQGVYGNPNARYIRPQGPYSRPYGGGYGGGLGLPIAGGIAGGLLLGGLLGGF